MLSHYSTRDFKNIFIRSSSKPLNGVEIYNENSPRSLLKKSREILTAYVPTPAQATQVLGTAKGLLGPSKLDETEKQADQRARTAMGFAFGLPTPNGAQQQAAQQDVASGSNVRGSPPHATAPPQRVPTGLGFQGDKIRRRVG